VGDWVGGGAAAECFPRFVGRVVDLVVLVGQGGVELGWSWGTAERVVELVTGETGAEKRVRCEALLQAKV
jgi:hypothetical protein